MHVDLDELRRGEDGRDDGERLGLQGGYDVQEVVDPAQGAVIRARRGSARGRRAYQVPLVHVTVMMNSARMVSEANVLVF